MAAIGSTVGPGGMSQAGNSMHRDHQRSSSFTAVNGAYQHAPNGDTHIMGDTITVQTDKPIDYEDRARNRPTPPPSRQENPYIDMRTNHYNRQQLPSPTETTTNGTKRKRSVSPEPQTTPPAPSHSRPQSNIEPTISDEEQYRQQAIQRLREGPIELEAETVADHPPQGNGGDPMRPSDAHLGSYAEVSPSQPTSSPNDSERAGRSYPQLSSGKSWPSTAHPPVYQNEPHQAHSETSGTDNIQRDLQGHDQSQGWGWNSDAGDGENGYSDSIHAQLGPKRKRNFSNRTKTGCMTCRKRKKKCDEGHPYCQNCHRGGFKCEGYSGRNPWPKSVNPAKAPVPLQSKDGYSETQDNGYNHEMRSPPGAQAQLPPIPQNDLIPRHVGRENEPPPGRYLTSPATITPVTQPTYPPQPWPSTGNPYYPAERHPKPDYRDLPPLHNPGRPEPMKDYTGVPPISEISRAPPGSGQGSGGMPPAWPNQNPSENRMPYAQPSAPPPAAIESKGPARRSLDVQPAPPMPMGEDAEKDKMIRGRLFRFMDTLLCDERDKCRAALWRLNNAGNPAFGISERERLRLLKQLFMPLQDLSNASPVPRINPQGSIGPNARVELPFKCHYGYNIKIGEDAYIGENCTIVDACQVTIGAKTWIGSNVTILTAMAHTDLQHRQGANSSWQGRAVTIEEDVYIGAGVMIYPGVTLARGAFVEPGSIVKTDQPQYGYLGYKPVYLSQGVPQ